MRTEGGGVGISASLFRPRSSVLRYKGNKSSQWTRSTVVKLRTVHLQ
jgi:hypothetical protein